MAAGFAKYSLLCGVCPLLGGQVSVEVHGLSEGSAERRAGAFGALLGPAPPPDPLL